MHEKKKTQHDTSSIHELDAYELHYELQRIRLNSIEITSITRRSTILQSHCIRRRKWTSRELYLYRRCVMLGSLFVKNLKEDAFDSRKNQLNEVKRKGNHNHIVIRSHDDRNKTITLHLNHCLDEGVCKVQK